MLNDTFNLNLENSTVEKLYDFIRQGIPSAIFGVPNSFKNYIVSTIDNQVVYVVKDIIDATSSKSAIEQFSNKKVVILPAKDELLLLSRGFSKDNLYLRSFALSNIKNADIIIITIDALMQSMCSVNEPIIIKKDTSYDFEKFKLQLVNFGYKRVDVVENKGEFAIRGDAIDIFSIDSEYPCKIDFFGDDVENIKSYEIESRKTISKKDEIIIYQTVEHIFSEDDYKKIKLLTNSEKVDGEGLQRRKVLLDDIDKYIETNDYDSLKVFSSIKDNSTFFDGVIKSDAVIIFDEEKKIYEVASFYREEFSSRLTSLCKAGESFIFLENTLLTIDDLKDRLNKYRLVALSTLTTTLSFFNPLQVLHPKVSGIANYRLDFKEVYNDISNWIKCGYNVTVCTMDIDKAEKFCFELSKEGIASCINKNVKTGVNIVTKKCDNGFIYHETNTVLIGSGNLYAKPNEIKRKATKKQTFFTAPETGDYCVHEVHGIGRVLGNKKITTTEGTKDYIAIEYLGGDILYVPVEQMDAITRYIGSEKSPRLSKIGGKDFEKIKSRVKESIRKMSFDLKKLYEERNSLNGFKFESFSDMQDLFTSSFEFEDTPDQTKAILDIYDDMYSGKVMDRLVCGDVGYGKTEVAFRAVFLAILNGKQCAMLAPTTILTEQHYNTAIKRFSSFGIRVAVLNRFKSSKEQNKIISDTKNGNIDFLIGTHRLLGKDIAFKDLGLLILDEEQRFGVEHKEKIKLLKKDVDTITLSATPIPRTLHMALSGIRSISTINTPPKKRLPVQTYVVEETDTLIKDVTLREINRGGQVFILYNRVETISKFSEHIRELLKDVKLTVVHGQMDEKMMENGIMDFYNGKTDVLISTTIIENGIDLPKANTLIVIDADKLGLSTLYQLKGRVGRSDRLAYAYFTFKRDKVLTSTAYERLNAIIEFAEMGSGIKIAMRDLEIRGAGNVLGAEQHGHMDKIGYELYSKLLKEELNGEEDITVDLDIRVSAFIPDYYIEKRSLKMDTYKEIAEISSKEESQEIVSRLNDEYGKIPDEVLNLINIATIKYLSKPFNVTEININKDNVNLKFADFNVFANEKLQNALCKMGKSAFISVTDGAKIEFVKEKDNTFMLNKVKEFLFYTI